MGAKQQSLFLDVIYDNKPVTYAWRDTFILWVSMNRFMVIPSSCWFVTGKSLKMFVGYELFKIEPDRRCLVPPPQISAYIPSRSSCQTGVRLFCTNWNLIPDTERLSGCNKLQSGCFMFVSCVWTTLSKHRDIWMIITSSVIIFLMIILPTN